MTTDTGARFRGHDEQPTLRVQGPADLAHAVPYLLGFHPRDSLVLVGLDGARVSVTARLDLAELDGPHAALLLDHTAAALVEGGARSVVGLLFDEAADPAGPADPGGRPPWRRRAVAVCAAVGESGLATDDVVLVHGGRIWSAFCSDAACCPPEGRPLGDGSRVAATATYAGLVALPDRPALARQLEPEPDPVRERLRPLLDEGERAAVGRLVDGIQEREHRSVKRALFAAAREADRPGGPPVLEDATLTRFGVALRCVQVRDPLWLALDARRLDGRALLRQLARRLPPPYDAAPLFLYGWSSYRHGDGALASVAVERVLASDPGYSAIDLLAAVLSRGISPYALPRLRAR